MPAAEIGNRPNFLVFMTDHQRGDTVLAEHPCITPNLDRLAAEGLTFGETHCPSPHCCPARATFFTGLYPSRHGVWNNICNDQALSRGLNDGVRTFGEDLADSGYRLAFSGKWHVDNSRGPGDRGWRELFVTANQAQEHGLQWAQWEKQAAEAGKKHPDPLSRAEAEILRPGWGTYTTYGPRADHAGGHDVTAVEKAVTALPELTAGEGPWGLYVGCTAPHDPYYAPHRFLDLYDLDDVALPPSYTDMLADKPRIYKRMRDTRWGQLSEREVREAIRHFWAMCSYLDEQFGQVLAALEATGQAHNTLVLYGSDHGDYCGEHGLFAKGIPCFRGAYHVPAVIRWPAGIANPGRRVDRFVSLADFAPTFQELAGCRVDAGLTGRSLVPFLRGETPRDWRDELHTQCNGVELYYTQRSVRTAEWKYVFNGFDDDELYHLADDPHEMHNVAADPAHAAVIRDMCRRMWRFAHRENDSVINPYITVSLAPHGPMEAFS